MPVTTSKYPLERTAASPTSTLASTQARNPTESSGTRFWALGSLFHVCRIKLILPGSPLSSFPRKRESTDREGGRLLRVAVRPDPASSTALDDLQPSFPRKREST